MKSMYSYHMRSSLICWRLHKTDVVARCNCGYSLPSEPAAGDVDAMLLSVSYWDGMRTEERDDDAAVILLIARIPYIRIQLMAAAASTCSIYRRGETSAVINVVRWFPRFTELVRKLYNISACWTPLLLTLCVKPTVASALSPSITRAVMMPFILFKQFEIDASLMKLWPTATRCV